MIHYVRPRTSTKLFVRSGSNQQPGYLEIHRDMVEKEITVPNEIVDWDGEFPYPRSDRHKINEAVRETAERFNRAHNPIVLVGIEAYRFKSAKDIVRLVEKMGVFVARRYWPRALSP